MTRIARLRGYVVACRLPEAQGNASGYYDTRGSLIVELVGDNGLSGWGETWHSPQAAAGAIRESLAAVTLGADALNLRALRQALGARRGYDRGGVNAMAIGAIEMAACDLAARTRGCPVSALLGGAVRDRVPAYAAGPYFRPGGDPYRDYAREAQAYVGAGFRALKAKVGRTPAADAAAVAAIRAAVGPDVALMVDANQGCTSATALAIAERMAEHDVTWFEEPVPPEDVAGYRAFARRSPIAASGGEALGELAAFAALIDTGIAVVQPDLSICGGFAAALEVTALAQAARAAVVPHVWGTGINLHASLQLAAILPAMPSGRSQPFPWLEMDRSPNPLRTLWGEPGPDRDGMVAIPDGPGIGIDIDAAHFAAHTVDHWSIDT